MNSKLKKIALNDRYSIIWISGKDSETFLQSQLTSDIEKMENLSASPTGYCSIKGRLIATAYICKLNEKNQYLLIVHKSIAEHLVDSLKKYLLRANVLFENKGSAYNIDGIIEENDPHFLEKAMDIDPISLFSIYQEAQSLFIRFPNQRTLIISPKITSNLGPIALKTRKIVSVDLDEWIIKNIENGIAEVSINIQSLFLPQMLNFQKHGGVSFKKGCYPGQEIVARTQYLGKVKKTLYRGVCKVKVFAGNNVVNTKTNQVAGKIIDCAKKNTDQYSLLFVGEVNCSDYTIQKEEKENNFTQLIVNEIHPFVISK